jgi:hypothetical protein
MPRWSRVNQLSGHGPASAPPASVNPHLRLARPRRSRLIVLFPELGP